MNVVRILVFIVFIALFIKQIYYLRDMIIATKKSTFEVIAIIGGVLVLAAITYFYKSQWYHYLFFVIASAALVCMCLKHGISSKGFLSQSRGQDVLRWDQIKKIKIVNYSNKVKLNVSGKFNSENFCFKKEDLDRIINIIKEHGIEINYGEF